jgi:hypothetical protein
VVVIRDVSHHLYRSVFDNGSLSSVTSWPLAGRADELWVGTSRRRAGGVVVAGAAGRAITRL